jgi:nucleotide-binding universal stress UspA family protein
MMSSRSERVVVATSGSATSQAAIVFAAQEAATRGLGLELVHVIPATFPAGPYAGAPDVALRHAGREVLAAGEELARRTSPDLEITTAVLLGSRPDAIVHHADDADLLVVGAPPHDLVERLWTGSTITGAAARASCPVAIVPEGPARPPSHQVLVGFGSSRHAGQLLATAFAVASLNQSELRFVHAWHQVSPYDEAIAERIPTPEWETEEARAIEDRLIDLRMAYPDVHVTVDVVNGQAAYVLVTESKAADLLMISRPLHGGFVHHLGATARAVIREASCPVLVVPPLPEPGGVPPLHAESALAP